MKCITKIAAIFGCLILAFLGISCGQDETKITSAEKVASEAPSREDSYEEKKQNTNLNNISYSKETETAILQGIDSIASMVEKSQEEWEEKLKEREAATSKKEAPPGETLEQKQEKKPEKEVSDSIPSSEQETDKDSIRNPNEEPPGKTEASLIQEKYPVQGGKSWMYHTLDVDWSEEAFCFGSDVVLAVFEIQIQEDLHTDIWIHYYIPRSKSEDPPLETDAPIVIDGTEYIWRMSEPFFGNCFPEYDGSVSIVLRCYDRFGNFLSDEIRFDRVDAQTLRVKSNSGSDLPLKPGNVFTR